MRTGMMENGTFPKLLCMEEEEVTAAAAAAAASVPSITLHMGTVEGGTTFSAILIMGSAPFDAAAAAAAAAAAVEKVGLYVDTYGGGAGTIVGRAAVDSMGGASTVTVVGSPGAAALVAW